MITTSGDRTVLSSLDRLKNARKATIAKTFAMSSGQSNKDILSSQTQLAPALAQVSILPHTRCYFNGQSSTDAMTLIVL